MPVDLVVCQQGSERSDGGPDVSVLEAPLADDDGSGHDPRRLAEVLGRLVPTERGVRSSAFPGVR